MKSAVTDALECAYSGCVGHPVSVEYVRRLYMIEMLKNMDVNNIDLQLARQFGCEYHEPWAENRTLVKQFLRSHKPELRRYLGVKVWRVVNDLIKGLQSITPKDFFKTPIDRATANSICRALDNVVNETEFAKNLVQTYTARPGLGSDLVRMGKNDYGDFEVADQLLNGLIQDHYVNHAPNRQHYDYRGAEWTATLGDALSGDYITKCFRCVMKHHKINLADWQKSNLVYNPNAWGHIFSVLYRLFYPRSVTPGNLHQCFSNVTIGAGPGIAQLLLEARRFSACSIESVIDARLPCLDHEFMVEEDYQRDQRHVIDSNSLCEEFLVLSVLIDNWERRNNAKYE